MTGTRADPPCEGISICLDTGNGPGATMAEAVAVAWTRGTRTFWHGEGDATQNVFLIGVGNDAINRLASQALASAGIGEGIRQPVDGVQAMVTAAGGGTTLQVAELHDTWAVVAVATDTPACGQAQTGIDVEPEPLAGGTMRQTCLGVAACGVLTWVDKTIAERTGV